MTNTQFNYTHIHETAIAWGLEFDETLDIFTWVNRNVSPHGRSPILARLLRRHRHRGIKEGRIVPTQITIDNTNPLP